MEQEIKEIHIIPAIYVEAREDRNVLLKCLQGDEVVLRAFEPRLFKGFENMKYVLLGIMTGMNTMTLTIGDGTEFENLYHEKWDVLLK